MITDQSFEQQMYLRSKRSYQLQRFIFKNEKSLNLEEESYRDRLRSYKLRFPVELTSKRCKKMGVERLLDMPLSELDLVLKLSTQQIINSQKKKQNSTHLMKQSSDSNKTVLCLMQSLTSMFGERDGSEMDK